MKNKKDKKQKKDLLSLLKELNDTRRIQGRMHELELILVIVVMSTMTGFYSLRAMGDFVKKNSKDLLKLFKPRKNRLPSRQTIGRALQNVDFDELSDIFYQWAINYVKIGKKEWISIDGKAIRGTLSGGSQTKKHNFINLVSMFVGKRKQIIKVGKIESKKQSEMPKVIELIKQLDLEGAIFTLDALHCTKKTTKTIVDSKNDYVIGLKGNRKKLHEQVKKT